VILDRHTVREPGTVGFITSEALVILDRNTARARLAVPRRIEA
jgi:hypothetical protein